jgi:hypothetical protein
MFGRRSPDSARDVRSPSSQPERDPVDVLAHEMAVAKLARLSGDWPTYEHARDSAVHLALTHRIEDEVSRYRQVVTACTGYQDGGEEARERILKKLLDAFTQAVDRGESARDVIVRMQRIPRAAATGVLVSGMRRGDGEECITFLLSQDGHLADDIRATFGDDPAQIAKRLTDRDWADFAMPLLAIAPGEPRQEVMALARQSLRSTLDAVASQ